MIRTAELAKIEKTPDAPANFSGPEWAMLAVLVGQLLSLPLANLRSGGPSFLGLMFIGCNLALPPMLVLWCCVRGGLWRYLIFLTVSLTNGILLTAYASHRVDLLVICLPLATSIPVLLTLAITKKYFGKFSHFALNNQAFDEGLQFKISHLFITTTALAILVAIGKAVVPYAQLDMQADSFWILGWICATIAINTLLGVWALLGKRAIFRSVLTFMLGVGLIIVTCKLIYGDQNSEVWFAINGIPFVAALGLLALFRRDGWRFRKK